MKRERNHSNVTFVTKVLLKRAICQNTLLLSTILTNRSNVIFVTKFFCKEQFKETYCWCSWKEEKNWMSLCNQKISLQKNLRKHSSEIHEVKKPLKCDICDHCFLKMAVWKYTCYQSMMKIKHSNVNLWLQFSYKGSLTKHIASVHNAKKSFKCDSFYKNKHIVKVHESKKPK